MQITGRIYIGDDDSRLIPIVIDLDGSMSIETADGRRIGALKPTRVEMAHVTADRFSLAFAGRVFGFVADDLDLTLNRFLVQLIDVQTAYSLLPDRGEPPRLARDSPDSEASTGGQASLGAHTAVESAVTDAVPAIEYDQSEASGEIVDAEGAPPTEPDHSIDPPLLATRVVEPSGADAQHDAEGQKMRRANDRAQTAGSESTVDDLSYNLITSARLATGPPRTRAAVARMSRTEEVEATAPRSELRHLLRSTAVRRLNIDGHGIAYRESGAGRQIVLVGGGFGSMHAWHDVTAALNERAHSVAIDLLGFGESDRLPGREMSGYSWERHVDLLDETLDRLSLDKDLTLMSYGLNAIPALMLARRRAERIRAVGCVEAILRPLAWHELQPWMRGAVKRARLQDEEYFLDSEQYLTEALREFAADSLGPAITASHQRAMGPLGTGRTGYMAALANLPVGGRPREVGRALRDAYQWLKGADIPKLVVMGEPGYFLIGGTRKLAERHAHQTIAVVQGHNLLLETAPVPVAKAITDWLETH